MRATKKRYLGRLASILTATAGVVVLLPAAAWSQPSGNDNAYAGAGRQYGSWNVSSRSLRLTSNPTGSMNVDRCMDALLDWHSFYGNHFDSRRVRSCKPGYAVETDPGGNGFWTERVGDFGDVDDMQNGGGTVIDDDYENGGFLTYATEGFRGPMFHPGSYAPHPRTCTDQWSRVRTLYQDGHLSACNESLNDPRVYNS